MRERDTRKPAERLRYAIECMPLETKRAMLEGVRANPIIVGAYVDGDGGICPMLAAHRNGGRTNFATFARAWDRYTDADARARRATERELRTLTTMLEASANDDSGIRGPLGDAVAEHNALVDRRTAEEADSPRTWLDEAEEDLGAASQRERKRFRRATRRRARPHDTGERHRGAELRGRHGWAWLRVFRRYDDYEAALERLDELQREMSPAAPAEDPHAEHSLA